MSDVDDDFMCEDEEDYGLVSDDTDVHRLHRFQDVSAFFHCIFLRNLFVGIF